MSTASRSADQERAEVRRAARALLREPLLRVGGRTADEFRLVRQHARELRDWFERNTGWGLYVDSEAARLRKSPGNAEDATHPARETGGARSPFTRRRYVLLCLALAVLERSETQIALGRLAEQVVLEAADPGLTAAGISFTLEDRGERADLVAVVRLLSRLGVIALVAGDDEDYLRSTGDALYDVRRRVLTGLLAGGPGPSLVSADSTPDRLAALTSDPVLESMDSTDLRNRRIRHTLTRRLLDDPVLYYSALTEEERTYLVGQRAAITHRISELTGLVAEVRAEGIAMADPDDDLTDVRMPEKGTHGHVTLLLAEYLAEGPPRAVPRAELEEQVRGFAERYGGYWSKAAKESGAERDLVARAVEKLEALALVRTAPDPSGGSWSVHALPALARFGVGEPVVRGSAGRSRHDEQESGT
ncbi:TIGR02678 family protein [Streptomonospora wellingtoniae]|uniref:TIGR02678 family protein n=1 Tax=Streptomonospora wellingtoniae TaxID=3075544 RepID=A0ABU2KZX8_9ACTN|nr:TIGR02678 family protein [Streptomonospora sp. DSM 45055]MDT0304849.1 TIGR02678 family protein [Streptomonospora sp. DSM 45055]